MKMFKFFIMQAIALFLCVAVSANPSDPGKPASVMLTSYSTTLIANGKDNTRMRIAIADSIGQEIKSAKDSVRIYVTGEGKITDVTGKPIACKTDSTGKTYYAVRLFNGICNLRFVAGTKPGKTKVEARLARLWPGSHEIHTLPASFMNKKPNPGPLPPVTKSIDRMIGADISFLPEMENHGVKFSDNGQQIDAMVMLHNHGFNYIRLRIFVNPENKEGYSPGKGFCGLSNTLAMARRIHDAGMKLLLDFHYSDYWADPQQQNLPKSWSNLDFKTLKDSVKSYTTRVLLALKKQGTLPSMVQVGNEINHGILWPEGHISNPDKLAELLKAGIEGVEAVDPNIPVMIHLALGGQNKEAIFWLDNMIARGLRFDVIGLSYYPRWHGTLADLKFNLIDLSKRYNKPVIVAEYSDFKQEVHDIDFAVPGNMGKGACIWEPLNSRSGLFDKNWETTPEMKIYDKLSKKYLTQLK
ncbi:MAG: glycosyl hydrolase 53 family protein [Bacteroidota bacterium]|nr:glycosyl hydrolase 53 family protein [Bacteroidota bacterium]